MTTHAYTESQFRRRSILLLVLLGLLLALPRIAGAAGKNTVVWISIDAFRFDYLKRINPPTLSRLAKEGAVTIQLRPIFPSLTYPNHTAQATGANVDGHGIPLNKFFDTDTKQVYSFPNNGQMLRAEPIWVTAKRQGLRVGVIDWPVSNIQPGPWKSDYTELRYDGDRTDQQRIDYVMHMLRVDPDPASLRLVMSYMSHVDSTGHKFGPDSPEVAQAVREADATIDGFLKPLLKWFDDTRTEDELYLLLTTDHGMEPVHTLLNFERLIGVELAQQAKIITDGGMAMVYLSELPPEQRTPRARAIVEKLKSVTYLRAWTSADVPKEFHFSDPTRIGDVVVVPKGGYAWTTDRNATTQPAPQGRLGNHGYDPAECPNMLGTAIVWRYRHPLGGNDLGPIDNTQWHATVARLLGIEPAKGSEGRDIRLGTEAPSTYIGTPTTRDQ